MKTDAAAPADEWRPQPYAERKSQHLNFGDFFMRGLFKMLVGTAAGTGLGMLADKMRGHQGQFGLAYWGGLIGAVTGGYFTWRRNEQAMLKIDEVYKLYKDLPELHRSNEELAADNALLKRMVEHQREQLGERPAAQTAGTIQRDGAVSESAERVVS